MKKEYIHPHISVLAITPCAINCGSDLNTNLGSDEEVENPGDILAKPADISTPSSIWDE